MTAADSQRQLILSEPPPGVPECNRAGEDAPLGTWLREHLTSRYFSRERAASGQPSACVSRLEALVGQASRSRLLNTRILTCPHLYETRDGGHQQCRVQTWPAPEHECEDGADDQTAAPASGGLHSTLLSVHSLPPPSLCPTFLGVTRNAYARSLPESASHGVVGLTPGLGRSALYQTQPTHLISNRLHGLLQGVL